MINSTVAWKYTCKDSCDLAQVIEKKLFQLSMGVVSDAREKATRTFSMYLDTPSVMGNTSER